MKPFLPDTNLLIALFWPSHSHHDSAIRWFVENRSRKWATCPMTEAGYIRIVSNPAFSRDAVTPVQALALLHENTTSSDHQFWADDISAQEALGGFANRLVGHQQVTDAYLLALAMRREGVLASFDTSITELVENKARFAESLEILRSP